MVLGIPHSKKPSKTEVFRPEMIWSLKVQIVACDCAKEHLAVVDELEISGVKTAWGKLPEDLEEAVPWSLTTLNPPRNWQFLMETSSN